MTKDRRCLGEHETMKDALADITAVLADLKAQMKEAGLNLCYIGLNETCGSCQIMILPYGSSVSTCFRACKTEQEARDFVAETIVQHHPATEHNRKLVAAAVAKATADRLVAAAAALGIEQAGS
jgi:hypothetical protein